MSRRSRNRGSRQGGGWWVKALVLVLMLAMLAVGGLHAWLRHYLHGEAFRLFLSEKLCKALRVQGEFTPFRWDGLAVGADGFEAVGEQVIRGIQVEDLKTEIGLGGFRRGVWEVEDFRVRRLSLALGDGSQENSAWMGGEVAGKTSKRKSHGWLPSEVEVKHIGIEALGLTYPLRAGQMEVQGVAVQGRSDPGGGYTVDLRGGEVHLPTKLAPRIRLDDAQLRYRDGGVFLDGARGRLLEDARLEAMGEFDSTRRLYAAQGTLGGVRCGELLSEDWKQRVTGDLATDFQVVSEGSRLEAEGHLVMTRGVVTALPLLDTLAAYTDTRRFRVLNLSEAHTDWHWQDGHWELRNLVLASDGLLRVEGGLSVRDRQLDGQFQLGIAPGTLATIPGAETKVFKPGKMGLLWTPITISGTLDHPQQDLKSRLIMAAGERILAMLPEEGVKLLDKSGKVPTEVIEQGADVIEEVGNILEGVLGGKR